MSRFGQAFARLSKREKIMVSVLGVAAVVGLIVFLNVMFQGKIDKLEQDIATERDALRQVYASTESYLTASRRFEASRTQAEENAKLTLTTAVAEIADGIQFDATDNRNNPLGRKHLKEFLEFNALKEKPVGPRKKDNPKSTSKSDEGYVERDQEFTLKGTVPFAAIYELMEKIEESTTLLFVTDLRFEKNPVDADRADNVKFTVSTYYFQEASAEESP
ncbi:MAG: hypothetical protein U1F43_36070 [Myxococcota bacterium]